MRRNRFALIALIVALFPAACGGAAAPTPAPLPTATLPPPTATPRPTATPAPTALACDLDRLREAAGNMNALDSYSWATVLSMQTPGESSPQQVLAQRTTVQLSDGRVTAMEMTSISDQPLVDLIYVDDTIYYRMSHGPWREPSAALAAALGDSIRQAWSIRPDEMIVLTAADCAPLREVGGGDAVGYRFSGVDVAMLAAILQTGLGDLTPEAIRSVEYTIWLEEVDGVWLLGNTQVAAVFALEGGEGRIEIKTGTSGINEPVLIAAPLTGVATTFALPLPLPDNAVVYVETETELSFFTAAAAEDIKAQTVAWLLAEGWTQGETREETVDGVTGEVIAFSREGQQLELSLSSTGEEATKIVSLRLTTP